VFQVARTATVESRILHNYRYCHRGGNSNISMSNNVFAISWC